MITKTKKAICMVLFALVAFILFPNVATAKVSSPSIPKNVTLKAGEKKTLKVKNKKKSQKITWKSTNSKVVSVKNGKLTAHKKGTATIQAKVKDKKKTIRLKCTVKVTPKSETKKYNITVGKENISLLEGDEEKLKLLGAGGLKISWTSTNPKIASVDEQGYVYGIKPGTTSILAKVQGKTYVFTIVVEKKYSTHELQVEAIQTGDFSKLTGTDLKVAKKAYDIIQQQIRSDMTDFQKVLRIHDYMVLNTEYDYDNYLNHTIPSESYYEEGILLKGTGVCNGYALTFQLFMDALGIDSKFVTGGTTNGPHAWNIVKVNGEWYYIDCTWDDPTPDRKGIVDYKYFLVEEKQFFKDHWPDEDEFEMPKTGTYKFLNEWVAETGFLAINNLSELESYISKNNNTPGIHTVTILTTKQVMADLSNVNLGEDLNYTCLDTNSDLNVFRNYCKVELTFKIVGKEPEKPVINYCNSEETFKQIFVQLYEANNSNLIFTFPVENDLSANWQVILNEYAIEKGYYYNPTQVSFSRMEFENQKVNYIQLEIHNTGIVRTEDEEIINWNLVPNPLHSVAELESYLNAAVVATDYDMGMKAFTPTWESSIDEIRRYLEQAANANQVDANKFWLMENKSTLKYNTYTLTLLEYLIPQV